MTREELKNHCKEQVEKCEKLAKYKGEEPYGKIYEEHKLVLELLEQESKSEWEHDHEILKAYADGANNALDKVKAEIIELRSKQNVGVLECLDIIDKYNSESEGK